MAQLYPQEVPYTVIDCGLKSTHICVDEESAIFCHKTHFNIDELSPHAKIIVNNMDIPCTSNRCTLTNTSVRLMKYGEGTIKWSDKIIDNINEMEEKNV